MSERVVTISYFELRDALRPLLAGMFRGDDPFEPWFRRCADAVWEVLLETARDHQ